MKLLRVRLPLCPAVCLVLLGFADPASAAPIEIRSCGTTIDTPGAYELAQDIGPCAGAGIVITASPVYLQLAGRTITGASSADTCRTGQPQIGIDIRPGTEGVTVIGGVVTGFTHGMSVDGFQNSVRSLRLLDNCAIGLTSEGQVHDLGRLDVRGSDVGVRLNRPSLVQLAFSVISGSRGNGIEVVGDGGANIALNFVVDNGAAGIALLDGNGTWLSDNTILNNGAGITVSANGCQLFSNLVNGNAVAGIAVAPGASGSLVVENIVRGNGIDLAENNECDVNRWERNDFAVSVGCVDRPLPQP